MESGQARSIRWIGRCSRRVSARADGLATQRKADHQRTDDQQQDRSRGAREIRNASGSQDRLRGTKCASGGGNDSCEEKHSSCDECAWKPGVRQRSVLLSKQGERPKLIPMHRRAQPGSVGVPRLPDGNRLGTVLRHLQTVKEGPRKNARSSHDEAKRHRTRTPVNPSDRASPSTRQVGNFEQPISRILSPAPEGMSGDHSSRTAVADGLERPTRRF